jgi:hypothetical protein
MRLNDLIEEAAKVLLLWGLAPSLKESQGIVIKSPAEGILGK